MKSRVFGAALLVLLSLLALGGAFYAGRRSAPSARVVVVPAGNPAATPDPTFKQSLETDRKKYNAMLAEAKTKPECSEAFQWVEIGLEFAHHGTVEEAAQYQAMMDELHAKYDSACSALPQQLPNNSN